MAWGGGQRGVCVYMCIDRWDTSTCTCTCTCTTSQYYKLKVTNHMLTHKRIPWVIHTSLCTCIKVNFYHYAHLLYHLTGGCLLFLSSLLQVCSFLGSVAILRSFCEGTFSGGASLIWGSHSPGGRTVTLSRNSSIPAKRSPLLRALCANTWRK